MPRHPVKPKPDTGAMTAVDKDTQLVRGAVARGRRKQRDRVVTPGTVKRKFGDRHHLDMVEAKIGDVGHQLISQLAIGEIAEALVDIAAPRAKMHFVDRYGRFAVVVPRTLAHPLAVLPHMA